MSIAKLQYLNNYLQIEMNNKFKDIIRSQISECHYEKNKIIIFEKEYINSVYLIIEGVVRGYYLNSDGDDVTKCFSGNNQIFGSECFRTKEPSTFFVEAITDCFVLKKIHSQTGIPNLFRTNS